MGQLLPGGVAPPGSLRTGLEPLNSSGSHYPARIHAAPAKNGTPSHAGTNPTYSSVYLNSSVLKVKTSTKKNLYLDLSAEFLPGKKGFSIGLGTNPWVNAEGCPQGELHEWSFGTPGPPLFFAFGLPELYAISFGILDPAEDAVVVLFDFVVDPDAF
jgi:hypothetical protein